MDHTISTAGGEAFGYPGIPPRWTSSAKEGVGTAYSTASRVWFTLSHILNEIYYPTIDRPQVRDMEFLITDGESFFHEEKRDLESTVSYVEEHTLGYSRWFSAVIKDEEIAKVTRDLERREDVSASDSRLLICDAINGRYSLPA